MSFIKFLLWPMNSNPYKVFIGGGRWGGGGGGGGVEGASKAKKKNWQENYSIPQNSWFTIF